MKHVADSDSDYCSPGSGGSGTPSGPGTPSRFGGGGGGVLVDGEGPAGSFNGFNGEESNSKAWQTF